MYSIITVLLKMSAHFMIPIDSLKSSYWLYSTVQWLLIVTEVVTIAETYWHFL